MRIITLLSIHFSVSALRGHSDAAEALEAQPSTAWSETRVTPQKLQEDVQTFLEQQNHEETENPMFKALETAWKFLKGDVGGYPVYQKPTKEILDFLHLALDNRVSGDGCQKQLGGLVAKLTQACEEEPNKGERFTGYIDNGKFYWREVKTYAKPKTCSESAKDIFLHGEDIVKADQIPEEDQRFGRVPAKTLPLAQSLDFLNSWIIKLATTDKAAMLWAGFWTNVSDPNGHESRTSKEQLFKFADLVEASTVHPSTTLGSLVEEHGDLDQCEGPIASRLTSNFWSFASFAFVRAMANERQDTVVALVHKELYGNRNLSSSVLYNYEIPTVGIAAWGADRFKWSPLVLVVDLLGACDRTSPELQKQLMVGLPPWYKAARKKYQTTLQFSFRSRVSWICLNCPPGSCSLDQSLVDHVQQLQQEQKRRDRLCKSLCAAIANRDIDEVNKSLGMGADANCVETVYGDGRPLMMCTNRAHTFDHRYTTIHSAAQLLIENRAAVDVGDRFSTPLLASEDFDNVPLVRILLNARADVNSRDSLGRTALHHVRNKLRQGSGLRSIEKMLLEHGGTE